MAPYLWDAFIGIAGGLTSGLLGVGGGAVYVPLLIMLRHFNAHLAIGTSIAVVVPTAVAAVLKHHQAGMVDWKAAGFIALFAVAGAVIGATVSVKLDVQVLRKGFAVFLLLLSAKMFFSN